MQFLSTWKLLQNKSMPVIGTRWRNNTQKSHELLKEKKINTTHLLLTSMQQIKPFGLYNENGAVPHTHDRLRRYPPNALAVFAYLAKSGCILYIVRTKKSERIQETSFLVSVRNLIFFHRRGQGGWSRWTSMSVDRRVGRSEAAFICSSAERIEGNTESGWSLRKGKR